ncbi:MAG: ABC transporter permease [Rhodospirillaceae bacterium]
MMKFVPLIWAGIWRKPTRTLLTLFALAMAFLLFAMLQGISAGLDQIVARGRMDMLIVVPRFGSPLPVAYKEQIAQMRGVKAVVGSQNIVGYYRDPKFNFALPGVDGDVFAVDTAFKVTPEQRAKFEGDRTAMIISPRVSNDMGGLKVGDQFAIKSMVPKADGSNDWIFNIVAIVDDETTPGMVPFAVGHFAYINEERAQGKDVFNNIRLIIDDADKAMEMSRAIDERFANSGAPTRTIIDREGVENGFSTFDWLRLMVIAIISATLFALLLLTSNTMIQSFRERTAELGVLKTIGFTERQILGLLLGESVAQSLVGAGIGLALAPALAPFVKSLQPFGFGQFIQVPGYLIGLGLVLAVFVGLISAALPARSAAKLTIIDALSTRR